MTAETDLLPLPRTLRHPSDADIAEHVQAYARACVSSATEALRVEVERANSWNERVSVCRDHVADIVDGPCVICALDAAEARADKLEEALREARHYVDGNKFPGIVAKLDALRDHDKQEETP